MTGKESEKTPDDSTIATPQELQTSEITDRDNEQGRDVEGDKVEDQSNKSSDNNDDSDQATPQDKESPVTEAGTDVTEQDDFETDVEADANIDVQLHQIKKCLGEQLDNLVGCTTLKDYTDHEKLKNNLTLASQICMNCENFIKELGSSVQATRDTVSEIKDIINKKIKEDDLKHWIKATPATESSDVQQVADEKDAVVRAKSARVFVATVRNEAAECAIQLAELEAQATEAEVEAEIAKKEALEAAKHAEEARIAAEAKAKSEEEARKKAQELQRIKDEEMRKKQDEEDRKQKELNRVKGTPEEERLRKEAEEKAQLEAERKNPNNWPLYKYTVEVGDFDQGFGALIRALPGTMDGQESLVVEERNQLDDVLELSENEELVSNIIQITQNPDDNNFKLEEPLAIAMPHCAPRNPYREVVMKFLEAGQEKTKWTELPAHDVILDDIKHEEDKLDPKFVEVRTKCFGIFALVTRLKKDNLTITRKGGKLCSSVDSRVLMQIKPGSFKVNVNFELQVQSIDSTSISDLKLRQPVDCQDLISSSPIIKLDFKGRIFNKPVAMSIPCPPNPGRVKQRPVTAATGRGDEGSGGGQKTTARPKSAFASKQKEANEEDEDDLYFLTRDENGTWSVLNEIQLVQSKKKDVAMFELTKPMDRILLLRTKVGIGSIKVEKIACLLEASISQRVVNLILRQKNDDPSDVVVYCVNSNKVDRTLRKLNEDGYEDGPATSSDIIAKEGQLFSVAFRGNLKNEYEDEMKFVFNSHLRSKIDLYIGEVDKFAQKSLDCYRGFAQFYKQGFVDKRITDNDDANSKKKNQIPTFEKVWDESLQCELLISLPKPEPETPKPAYRAPFKYNPEGPVDEKYLRYLASDLGGDEWKLLAPKLNIKSQRIQAILRNNVNADNDKVTYDMLMTWCKKLPRCINKVDKLVPALESIGRYDLAKELLDHTYRQDDQEDA